MRWLEKARFQEQVTAATAVAATVFSSTGVARAYLLHQLIALCYHQGVDLSEGSHRSTTTAGSDPSRAELRGAVSGREEELLGAIAAAAVTSLLYSSAYNSLNLILN